MKNPSSQTWFSKFATIDLVLLAAALPLSIAASSIFFFTLLGVWVLSAAWRHYPLCWGPAEKAFVAFFLLGVLSALLGVAPPKSLFTLRDDFYFLILVVVAALCLEENGRRRLLLVFFWASCVAALLGIAQYLLGANLPDYGGPIEYTKGHSWLANMPDWFVKKSVLHNFRSVGPRSHPLTFSEGLLLGFTLGLGMLVQHGRRIKPQYIVGMLILLGGLLVSKSRSSWLAMFVCTFVASLMLQRGGRWRAWAILAIPLILLAASPSLRTRAGSIFNRSEESNSQRLRMWTVGGQILRQSPWFGIGPGNVKRVSAPYQTEAERKDGPFGHLHNTFINAAVERGLIGLGSLLVMLGVFAHLLWRRFRYGEPEEKGISAGALLGLLAFVICSMTETVYNDADILMAFYFCLGLGMAGPIVPTHPDEISFATRGRNLVALVVGLAARPRKVSSQEVRQQLRSGAIRKVLFIRINQGIGDLLLATPVFRAFNEAYPAVALHFVASAHNVAAVKESPRFKKIFIWPKRALTHPAELYRLWQSLRQEHYDLVIPLVSNIPSFNGMALGKLARGRILWSVNTRTFYGGANWSQKLADVEVPAPSEELPEYQKFTGVLEELLPISQAIPEYHPTPQDDAVINQLWQEWATSSRPQVLFFLGGNTARANRLWSAAAWAELAKLLEKENVGLIAIRPPKGLGAGKEADFYDDFREALGHDILTFDKKGLGLAAALVRRANLFICPDGGLFHVAVAAGARTLGLFFGTDPKDWTIPVPWSSALRAPAGDPNALRPAEVAKKVMEILSQPLPPHPSRV